MTSRPQQTCAWRSIGWSQIVWSLRELGIEAPSVWIMPFTKYLLLISFTIFRCLRHPKVLGCFLKEVCKETSVLSSIICTLQCIVWDQLLWTTGMLDKASTHSMSATSFYRSKNISNDELETPGSSNSYYLGSLNTGKVEILFLSQSLIKTTTPWVDSSRTFMLCSAPWSIPLSVIDSCIERYCFSGQIELTCEGTTRWERKRDPFDKCIVI